ncbi:MAG: hypothetical protein ACU84J_04755, partial [Gammaproteobacteria bacterium]
MAGLSAILEVVIGLAFVYLLLSLFVTAFVEYVEIWLRKRGRLLRLGLKELLSHQSTHSGNGDLVDKLYLNPLIYALYKDKPHEGGALTAANLPSYIPPNVFVMALIDELSKTTSDALDKRSALKTATDLISVIEKAPQLSKDLKSALGVLLSQVPENDYNQAVKTLEDWYSTATDRVSGWYKKHTQWLSLGFSLLIVIAVNVDTLYVTQALMVNSSLREAIVGSVEASHPTLGVVANTGECKDMEECEKQALIRVESLRT